MRKTRNIKESKMIVFASWRHDENYKPQKRKSKSFTPMTHSMLMSEAFMRLKSASKMIYMYMTDHAMGQEYTTFPKSRYEKITTKGTFESAKRELIQFGFIEEVENGKNTRTENVYKFIDKWKTVKLPEKKKRQSNFNKKTL